MQDLDFSALDAGMFIISMIFIMVIGTFFSLGILRLFQLKKRSAVTNLVAGTVSLALFVVVIIAWT